MSNYVKSTDFAAKDALASGNAGKIVKGTEIDTEFNNIATAVATKADLASPALTGTPTAPTPSVGDNDTSIATTAFVQTALQALYPVGSVYINANVSTNPGTLLGFGTWTAFAAGRVLVGLDGGTAAFGTAEETVGSADAVTVAHTHTFTTGGMSANVTHTHTYTQVNGYSGVNLSTNQAGRGPDITSTTSSANLEHTHSGTTASTGSSGTNANLQPYIVVYMWKRTA